MVIRKPIVENWDSTDRIYFSEIKDGDLLSAQNIALSNEPNNTLKIDKERLLCLPCYFILGSGRFEEDMIAYKRPFKIIFPCYKSFSTEQLISIGKQYQIFVRFNSYLACEKTESLPQNITHGLYGVYGNKVEPSSLLYLDERFRMKPASYLKKINIKEIEKFFSIVKKSGNEEIEYSVFSINNEVYPLHPNASITNGMFSIYLSVENRFACPSPFKHFYEYELFAVKKS